MASQQTYDEPRTCANGCGFFGRPETEGMCSKCYKDQIQRKEAAKALPIAAAAHLNQGEVIDVGKVIAPQISAGEGSAAKPRCGHCNKKVGLLTSFKCKCDRTYCTSHRYPEEHACTFNFKAVGREALAAANPIVRADKIERI